MSAGGHRIKRFPIEGFFLGDIFQKCLVSRLSRRLTEERQPRRLGETSSQWHRHSGQPPSCYRLYLSENDELSRHKALARQALFVLVARLYSSNTYSNSHMNTESVTKLTAERTEIAKGFNLHLCSRWPLR